MPTLGAPEDKEPENVAAVKKTGGRGKKRGGAAAELKAGFF